MNNFPDLVRADRRLVIIRLLAQADSYTANQYLLHAALPGFGHNVSEDVVVSDLDWLEEQGLVTNEDMGGVRMVKLTRRGDDVQAGRAKVTGVKRPRPE
jgi:Fe2+ or Zn2+ uptake regulation protein